MPVQFSNPYAEAGTRWLKGEIHAHVNRDGGQPRGSYACGKDPDYVYQEAADAGLNFVCMSVEVLEEPGVDRFGDVGTGSKHGVTGIPAREIQNNYYPGYFGQGDAKYLHVLTLGEKDGLSLCVHPAYYGTINRKVGGDWSRIRRALYEAEPRDALGELGVCGLEVYNAFAFMQLDAAGRDKYEDLDEECWDDMLVRGKRFWGFAGNDSYFSNAYEFRDIPYRGFVYAAVAEGFEQADILTALKGGRFYASTGVELAPVPIRVTRVGASLRVEVKATKSVNWTCHVHRNGALERLTSDGRAHATFTIRGAFRYFRVSCRDPQNRWKRAWLQPITNPTYFP
jgi:hypothetical protein